MKKANSIVLLVIAFVLLGLLNLVYIKLSRSVVKQAEDKVIANVSEEKQKGIVSFIQKDESTQKTESGQNSENVQPLDTLNAVIKANSAEELKTKKEGHHNARKTVNHNRHKAKGVHTTGTAKTTEVEPVPTKEADVNVKPDIETSPEPVDGEKAEEVNMRYRKEEEHHHKKKHNKEVQKEVVVQVIEPVDQPKTEEVSKEVPGDAPTEETVNGEAQDVNLRYRKTEEHHNKHKKESHKKVHNDESTPISQPEVTVKKEAVVDTPTADNQDDAQQVNLRYRKDNETHNKHHKSIHDKNGHDKSHIKVDETITGTVVSVPISDKTNVEVNGETVVTDGEVQNTETSSLKQKHQKSHHESSKHDNQHDKNKHEKTHHDNKSHHNTKNSHHEKSAQTAQAESKSTPVVVDTAVPAIEKTPIVENTPTPVDDTTPTDSTPAVENAPTTVDNPTPADSTPTAVDNATPSVDNAPTGVDDATPADSTPTIENTPTAVDNSTPSVDSTPAESTTSTESTPAVEVTVTNDDDTSKVAITTNDPNVVVETPKSNNDTATQPKEGDTQIFKKKNESKDKGSHEIVDQGTAIPIEHDVHTHIENGTIPFANPEENSPVMNNNQDRSDLNDKISNTNSATVKNLQISTPSNLLQKPSTPFIVKSDNKNNKLGVIVSLLSILCFIAISLFSYEMYSSNKKGEAMREYSIKDSHYVLLDEIKLQDTDDTEEMELCVRDI